MRLLIACAFLSCLCGCDQVFPKIVPSGGGSVSPIDVPIRINGTGEPMSVPLNVVVTVTEKRVASNASDCRCGCDKAACDCSGVSARIIKEPQASPVPEVAAPRADALEIVVLEGQLASQLAEADLIAAGIPYRRVTDDSVSRPSLRYRGNIASPQNWYSGGDTLNWCLSQVGHARAVQLSRPAVPQVQYQPQCQGGFCPLPRSRR